jgi:CheY-like chemotaxis protein
MSVNKALKLRYCLFLCRFFVHYHHILKFRHLLRLSPLYLIKMPLSTTARTLIIEDSEVIVFLLQTAYQKAGLTVVGIGSTAKEAVELTKQHEDLAFISMDIYLESEETGIDAARQIRALGIDTPIVFISGNSDLFEQTTAISKSFCMEKPVDVGVLLRKIAEL